MTRAGDRHFPDDVFGFTPPRGKIVRVCMALPPRATELMPIRRRQEWPHATADQDGDGERSHNDKYQKRCLVGGRTMSSVEVGVKTPAVNRPVRELRTGSQFPVAKRCADPVLLNQSRTARQSVGYDQQLDIGSNGSRLNPLVTH